MNAETLFELPPVLPSHPAKYTEILLPTVAAMLNGRKRILDPFGGTGRVFLLENWLGNVEIQATEIEEPWAARNPRTTLGNALHLPWPDGYFDAVATSPAYGNRMADTLLDSGKYKRMTYTALLQRQLHPDNAGAIQWGDKYQRFHREAWIEARRVLQPGSAFVLNIKDHIRTGLHMPVTAWHIACLESLGFRLVQHEKINTPGMTRGQNGDARVPYESVIQFELEAA
jgi:tRNA G10  N-methylase Trm11